MKIMMLLECKHCHEIYETHYSPQILICRECRSTEFVVLGHLDPTESLADEKIQEEDDQCLSA